MTRAPYYGDAEISPPLSVADDCDDCFVDPEQAAQQDEQEEDDGGVYMTLQTHGPQTTAGSDGHPENCMPCTFYCFTRRGCNRGTDCRFCHLGHQSKLQQRREAWKKQQREKRKCLRERLAFEASSRRRPGDNAGPAIASPATMQPTPPQPVCQRAPPTLPGHIQLPAGGATAAPGGAGSGQDRLHNRPGAANNEADLEELSAFTDTGFYYSPTQVTFTLGQDVCVRPHVAIRMTQFRVASALPPGLRLDAATGVISGMPETAMIQNVIIEADSVDNRKFWSTLEVEVVDFSQEGFVLGHLSEFAPGRYMMLMFIPDKDGDNPGGDQASQQLLDQAGMPKLPPQQMQQLQIQLRQLEQQPQFPPQQQAQRPQPQVQQQQLQLPQQAQQHQMQMQQQMQHQQHLQHLQQQQHQQLQPQYGVPSVPGLKQAPFNQMAMPQPWAPEVGGWRPNSHNGTGQMAGSAHRRGGPAPQMAH
eukprot:TRINITY_DN8951_c0_g1_i1.p1 TRINITY_DN8951_c0_g1~~TRINITY_DN8951_c0_g1_i1.p1  ORF type:complete len:474 (+),score=118.14 TRINITY_DN8951_c0_g1_i1:145-1566(+)